MVKMSKGGRRKAEGGIEHWQLLLVRGVAMRATVAMTGPGKGALAVTSWRREANFQRTMALDFRS